MIVALRLKFAMASRVQDFLLTHSFDSESANRVVGRFVGGVEQARTLLARHEREENALEILRELQVVTRTLMQLLVRLDGIARFRFRGKPELMESWVNARQITWTPSVVEDAISGSPAPDAYVSQVDAIGPG